MAGYSGTPLAKKLGISAGANLAIISSPNGFCDGLELPDGVTVRTSARGRVDVLVFFATRRAELTRRFPAMKRAIDVDGGLWIAWPKKSSGVVTDITEDVVRERALAAGVVDVKVCAIDATWSGLKLVRRLQDR